MIQIYIEVLLASLISRNLEVKVVDGGKCTQAVVTQPEVWVLSFCRHVKGKQEAVTVNPLWQALKNARDQKHMPIFNWTNLLNCM
jgi:hypothetical protein